MPFSLWDGLQITFLQMIFLIAFATGISYWLMERSKRGIMLGFIALLCFVVLRSWSFLIANSQEKIIVYNVPQRRAIDLVNGRNYFFIGDSDLLTDDFIRNFHLKPSRILHRMKPGIKSGNLLVDSNYITYNNKNILLIDKSVSFLKTPVKQVIDLLVISKNPKIYIQNLADQINIKQIVFDGSNSTWKIAYWKKDCDSLYIPYYDVNEKGAFVMNVN